MPHQHTLINAGTISNPHYFYFEQYNTCVHQKYLWWVAWQTINLSKIINLSKTIRYIVNNEKIWHMQCGSRGGGLTLPSTTRFCGLHLNHLIVSQVAIFDWQFGILPFGLFGSNLDICHFLTIQGLFEYFQKMGAVRKSKFSKWKNDCLGSLWFSFVCTGP